MWAPTAHLSFTQPIADMAIFLVYQALEYCSVHPFDASLPTPRGYSIFTVCNDLIYSIHAPRPSLGLNVKNIHAMTYLQLRSSQLLRTRPRVSSLSPPPHQKRSRPRTNPRHAN